MQILAMISMLAAVAPIQDALRAEPGVFGDPDLQYKAALARFLLADASGFPQVVIIANKHPEESVYVDYDSDDPAEKEDCRIVSNRLRRRLAVDYYRYNRIDPLSGTSLPARKIPPPPAPEVDRATAFLPRAVCDDIDNVWMAAMLRVRPIPRTRDEVEITMNADNYYFSVLERLVGARGGSAQTPNPGSKMADLVHLAADLSAFARSNVGDRPRLASRLSDAARRLTARFEKEDPLPK